MSLFIYNSPWFIEVAITFLLVVYIYLHSLLIPMRCSMIPSTIFVTMLNYLFCLTKLHILFSFIHSFRCFQSKTNWNKTTIVKVMGNEIIKPFICRYNHIFQTDSFNCTFCYGLQFNFLLICHTWYRAEIWLEILKCRRKTMKILA